MNLRTFNIYIYLFIIYLNFNNNVLLLQTHKNRTSLQFLSNLHGNFFFKFCCTFHDYSNSDISNATTQTTKTQITIIETRNLKFQMRNINYR